MTEPTRATPPSRRERRKQETRQRLLDVATELMREHGFEGTRVEDITEGADVAIGTFFNYFATKDALLQEFHRASLERAIAQARTLRTGTARSRFERHFRARAKHAQDSDAGLEREFMRRLMANPQITAPNRPLVRELISIYIGWIEEGQGCGEIRAGIDPSVAAMTLNELWSHSSLRWAGNPQEVDLEPRILSRVKLVFEGMGT